ncbi:MAG: GreA/GreB family elongation factor [Rariglobus sp.]|nr:GreA/GreB family elongation factor [Rariglobus sp.]
MSAPLYLLDSDAASLRHRLNSLSQDPHSRRALSGLRAEVERAVVLAAGAFPPEVVRINSSVEVHDLTDGETARYTLCFPEHAEITAGRLSVFAPLGTALLGFPSGHEFTWEMPGGPRRLRILGVTPPNDFPAAANPAARPALASR